MKSTTLAFTVTIRGTLTVDKASLEKEMQARGISKAQRGSEMVQVAIERMAPPNTGPLAFEKVEVPLQSVHST